MRRTLIGWEKHAAYSFWVLYALGTPILVSDHRVRVFARGARKEVAFREKLSSALGLIRRCDTRCYRLLQRDVARILIYPYPVAAAHIASAHAIVLDSGFLGAESVTPLALASLIVHEGMHARLTYCGIHWTEERRVRIERICHREQLRFLERAGADRSLLEWAAKQLSEVSETATTAYHRVREREYFAGRGIIGKFRLWLMDRSRGG